MNGFHPASMWRHPKIIARRSEIIVAEGHEHDKEDDEPEVSVRVYTQVEDQDGNFGEAGSEDVDYDVGVAPLEMQERVGLRNG